jgi:hypothetical protein
VPLNGGQIPRKNITLLRAAIDKIADKYDAAICMTEHAIVFPVVHFMPTAPEDSRMSVDVADDVEIVFDQI